MPHLENLRLQGQRAREGAPDHLRRRHPLRVLPAARLADGGLPRGLAAPAAHAGKLLAKTSYAASLAYDALNRMRLLRYPQTVDGTRKALLPRYDLGGR